MKALNINPEDGVIRISMTHYNSQEDCDNLIKAFDKI